ncbi:MAG: cytochrome C oxidase subunit IV family protein [Anaerolineae bacterium]
MEEKKKIAFRQGLMVLIGLAALTGFEFWVALFGNVVVWLFIIALFKGGLIVQYFMHIASLWTEEEGH